MEKQHRLLLIEDNEGDLLLARLALEEVNFQHKIHTCRSIGEGLNLLKELPYFDCSPPVDYILLDLNLLGRYGITFIEELKQDAKLQIIPIFVFTTSSSQKDIYECYKAQANLYITKPLTYEGYVSVFGMLKQMCSHVQPPKYYDSEKCNGHIGSRTISQGETSPF